MTKNKGAYLAESAKFLAILLLGYVFYVTGDLIFALLLSSLHHVGAAAFVSGLFMGILSAVWLKRRSVLTAIIMSWLPITFVWFVLGAVARHASMVVLREEGIIPEAVPEFTVAYGVLARRLVLSAVGAVLGFLCLSRREEVAGLHLFRPQFHANYRNDVPRPSFSSQCLRGKLKCARRRPIPWMSLNPVC